MFFRDKVWALLTCLTLAGWAMICVSRLTAVLPLWFAAITAFGNLLYLVAACRSIWRDRARQGAA